MRKCGYFYFFMKGVSMKRILAFLLAILIAFCNCGTVFAESATPTDLECEIEYAEFEDDDFGHIDAALLTPRIFIEMSPEYVAMYEEVTLWAILIDVPENHYIEWEYSEDCEHWTAIEGEHETTYLFVITPENMNYWWRVRVIFEG